MRRAATVVVATVLAAPAAGCDVLATGPIVIELARIDTAGSGPTVPSTVRTGEPFVVEIPTLMGFCSDLGPVQIDRQGGTLVLTPYTRTDIDRDTLCPGALRQRTHVAELEWESSVDFELLVHGIDEWTGGPLLLRFSVEVED